MSIGWFDAFRENGAPTWYGENRTPVVMDLQIAALLSLFLTPTLAFLLILPGIRRFRLVSSFTFLSSMLVGAILLLSIHYPCWQQGEVHIFTTYKAFSGDRLNAVMGVKIGLNNVNVTLTSRHFSGRLGETNIPELDFNERFEFIDGYPSETERALTKGMPYPLLKVVEYLSVGKTGFNYGKQYRVAGYYALVLLWCAFASWVLQMLLLCILPHKFAHLTIVTGAMTVAADLVYYLNVPRHLWIRYPSVEGGVSVLEFKFSHCFYLTLGAGIASVILGWLLWLAQTKTSYMFETFLSAQLDELIDRKRRRLSITAQSTASCGSASSTGSISRSSSAIDDSFASGASTTSVDRYSRVFIVNEACNPSSSVSELDLAALGFEPQLPTMPDLPDLPNLPYRSVSMQMHKISGQFVR